MSSLLNIGSNATASFQSAIATTAHNIANIGTEGFSRQRAEISSTTSSSHIGSGSRIDSIERISASYIQNQLSSANSLKLRFEEQLSLAKNVEGIIVSNDEGIQKFMQSLFDSFQNLANSPTSNVNKNLVVNEAHNTESLIANLSAVLKDTQAQANSQISAIATEVNKRLDTIQTLNNAIANSFVVGFNTPNDLLDQRDQAILELNGYMDVRTFTMKNGEINVFTGDSRLPLVSGNTVNHLKAERSEFSDQNRIEVFMSIGGKDQQISDAISNGRLGAVLDYRTNMLDQAMNDLGVTLNALVAATNWQHYQGFDTNGNAGQHFFQPLNMHADASIHNTGAEDGTNITVNFTPEISTLAGFNGNPPYTNATQPATYGNKNDFLEAAHNTIGDFKAREYEVRVNVAGNFEVFDHKGGTTPLATIAFGGNAQIDGLNFDFSAITAGTVNTGDKFLIKPHQQILTDFKTAITNGSLVATRGQSPVDSNSDGSILDETPATASAGDNINIANMASLQSLNLLFNNENGDASTTILGSYSKMVTNIGTYTHNTQIQLTVQSNVFEQISARRESMSGVSLDEEAANLLRFQQAFQAAAQIMQTSQSLFQTILRVLN